MNTSTIIAGLALLLLAVGIFWNATHSKLIENPLPRSYEDCVARGYAVSETTPRTCSTPEGLPFTEGNENLPGRPEESENIDEGETNEPRSEIPVAGSCVIAGCSGELCIEEGSEPGVSACMYREEFACYGGAQCKRQTSGQCGWTTTDELQACLSEASTTKP